MSVGMVLKGVVYVHLRLQLSLFKLILIVWDLFQLLHAIC